jgi:hypothetical protein
MSFLRHKEIYPFDGGAGLAAGAPLIVRMSFRLVIPWRDGLHQWPPPLRQPLPSMKRNHDAGRLISSERWGVS